MKKDNDTRLGVFILFVMVMGLLFGYGLASLETKQINMKKEIDKETNEFLEKVIKEKQVKVSKEIDLDKIWMIESSKGKDLWNKKSRARGHYQFLESTWNECVKKMGKDWDWWSCSMDKNKSELVAHYYYDVEIPRLLNHFRINDTVETRIACYSWGIGHLNKAWDKYAERWRDFAPEDTKKYIRDYHKL